MNVAVPLLQHSQWFGHFALSQTVCSLSSSSSERVRENVSEVGSVIRNHSGKRGRGFNSVVVTKLFCHRLNSDETRILSFEFQGFSFQKTRENPFLKT